jgi:glycosyltransferase involved in cell wall biosynthesis
MRIALLAPLWMTVPPKRYGGTELVVANLAKGLAAHGHQVTTFACGGSKVAGRLVKVIPRPLLELVDGYDWNAVKPHELLVFAELFRRKEEFDIVHNHNNFPPVAIAPLLGLPFLTTLHSSAPAGGFSPLAQAFKDYPFVSISDAQRLLEPELNYVATIHHGVDTDAFRPRLRGKGNGFSPVTRYPDFVAIAHGFGWDARSVVKKDELTAAIQEMIDSPKPYLLDVTVPYQEHVLPMIPAGMTVRETIRT